MLSENGCLVWLAVSEVLQWRRKCVQKRIYEEELSIEFIPIMTFFSNLCRIYKAMRSRSKLSCSACCWKRSNLGEPCIALCWTAHGSAGRVGREGIVGQQSHKLTPPPLHCCSPLSVDCIGLTYTSQTNNTCVALLHILYWGVLYIIWVMLSVLPIAFLICAERNTGRN